MDPDQMRDVPQDGLVRGSDLLPQGEKPAAAPANAADEGLLYRLTSAQGVLQNEHPALQALLELDLGEPVNAEARLLLGQVEQLSDLVARGIKSLSPAQPKFRFAENLHHFVGDIDLNGGLVVVAEFGRKSELLPGVIEAGYNDTSYAGSLFFPLERSFMPRRAEFIARSSGRREGFEISMRGLSFQHPTSATEGGLDRAVSTDNRLAGALRSMLTEMGNRAVEIVSPDESLGIDYAFEQGVSSVAVATFLGRDTNDNRILLDALGASLKGGGNYSVESDQVLELGELSKIYPGVHVPSPVSGVQLTEWICVRRSAD